MGLLSGLVGVAFGTVKTGIGIAADVVTMGTNAIDDELYTKKGLREIGEGFEDIFELD